jgi:3-deoxy-7-phosphoheptulonate synthase
MSMTRLLFCFRADAPAKSVDECRRLLGLVEPGPLWRWFAPGLLVASFAAPPDAALLARVRALAGLREIVDRTAVPATPARCRFGARELGGGEVLVIGGPCSVEGGAMIDEIAAVVAEHGGAGLRGGAFKPRTSPYSFGGLGEAGLELLAAAGARRGLPIVTEVLEVAEVGLVARHADMLQIGSRNMHNYPLLFAAGANAQGRPVLLKRGFGATVDELRGAAEYVELGRVWAGNPGAALVLCERGVRTFEPGVRDALDVAAIPLLQRAVGRPVIADPSHAAGRRDLVRPLALAAVAAGADGLLVEVHTDPDRAWSDAAQTLDPAGFAALVREVGAVAAALGRSAPTATAASPRRGS